MGVLYHKKCHLGGAILTNLFSSSRPHVGHKFNLGGRTWSMGLWPAQNILLAGRKLTLVNYSSQEIATGERGKANIVATGHR